MPRELREGGEAEEAVAAPAVRQQQQQQQQDAADDTSAEEAAAETPAADGERRSAHTPGCRCRTFHVVVDDENAEEELSFMTCPIDVESFLRPTFSGFRVVALPFFFCDHLGAASCNGKSIL